MLKGLLKKHNSVDSGRSLVSINCIHDCISKCMLKAARQAEVISGFKTSNGVNKRRVSYCVQTPAISCITKEIGFLVASDDVCELNKTKIRSLRKDLRRIQWLGLYKTDRKFSININTLLYEDRGEFWKQVSKSRKLNAKRAPIVSKKPSACDFVEYYKTLFSHVDRPSNESHAKITLEVKDYEKLVNDEQCNISFSKQLISEALDQLKIGKSCGYGGISNEFYIYGRSDQLTDILYLLYNSMLNSGT